MANVIAKAYDATKKIVKSVFLGKPNLFTTSDVNRHIEQIRSELDFLHRMVGFESDFTVNGISSQSENLTRGISTSYSYIRYRGMSFSPANVNTDIDFSGMDTFYIFLMAKEKRVTFNDDPTHEISGAKFDDGSSMASADQIVMYDEKIVVTSDYAYAENGFVRVGLIGHLKPYIWVVSGETSYYKILFSSNCTEEGSVNNSTLRKDTIDDTNTYVSGNIPRGETYSNAILKIRNNLRNMFYSPMTGFASQSGIYMYIGNGCLSVSFPNIVVNVTTTDTEPRIVRYSIDSEYKSVLSDYYRKLLIVKRAPIAFDGVMSFKGYFIPLSDAHVVTGYEVQPPYLGSGRFGLFIEVSGEDAFDYEIEDIYFVGILESLVKITGDGTSTTDSYGVEGGPIVASIIRGMKYVVKGATVTIPIIDYGG